MTDWWHKPRKWNIPLTYEPKIARVCDGSIRQTLQCPKLSKKNMDERTVSLAVDRPARTTTALHE